MGDTYPDRAHHNPTSRTPSSRVRALAVTDDARKRSRRSVARAVHQDDRARTGTGGAPHDGTSPRRWSTSEHQARPASSSLEDRAMRSTTERADVLAFVEHRVDLAWRWASRRRAVRPGPRPHGPCRHPRPRPAACPRSPPRSVRLPARCPADGCATGRMSTWRGCRRCRRARRRSSGWHPWPHPVASSRPGRAW